MIAHPQFKKLKRGGKSEHLLMQIKVAVMGNTHPLAGDSQRGPVPQRLYYPTPVLLLKYSIKNFNNKTGVGER